MDTSYTTAELELCREQDKISFKAGQESEQERILAYLKRLLVSNPKASLAATIYLIEATKPNSESTSITS